MFRRKRTSPDPKQDSTDADASSLRSVVADSAWATQDRVRVGLSQAIRATPGALSRTFERLTYPLQERLVWPVEDRAETMGAPARALTFGVVVVLAAAAGVAGLIWAAPDGPHNTVAPQAAATSAPLAEVKATSEKRTEPTLHGAAPIFKPAKGQSASEVDPAKAIVKSSPSGSSSESSKATSPAAASSSSAKSSGQTSAVDGAPAGPAAVSVARGFAGAFVVYETGGIDASVRKAFAETATQELSRALLRRPPRLPANVKVPQAKVVNVVPAPSHGDVYPVSVSLLRVGLTSELRLEMEQLKGDGWRVTNVLG